MAEPVHAIDINPDDIETVYVGWFRYRRTRGAPWQAVRVMHQDEGWFAFVNGEVVTGSGARLAKDVAFLLWHAPFHEITEDEYHDLLREYEAAGSGHPLRQPGERVDLRSAPPLYERKKR